MWAMSNNGFYLTEKNVNNVVFWRFLLHSCIEIYFSCCIMHCLVNASKVSLSILIYFSTCSISFLTDRLIIFFELYCKMNSIHTMTLFFDNSESWLDKSERWFKMIILVNITRYAKDLQRKILNYWKVFICTLLYKLFFKIYIIFILKLFLVLEKWPNCFHVLF